eukprot:TRINITY_DN3630_c0_g1_i1.p1 TRINITY_DN3630_c0_g1~~TRINITY_DN3630_c0_g1_i1.p1  ORF type:complete len:290 (+),score=33.50 TRINITY_DN3630_c0_g1_i1:121-990(+)
MNQNIYNDDHQHHSQVPLQPQPSYGQAIPAAQHNPIGVPQPQPQFANFADSTYAKVGLDLGGKVFDNSEQYLRSNMDKVLQSSDLKRLFKVDNNYVVSKLKLVLLPFIHKGSWSRRVLQDQTGSGDVANPRDDVFSPDLYIPVMAAVTYILMQGLLQGAAGSFNPEILGMAASTLVFTLTLEVSTIKLGMYLTSAPAPMSWYECAAIAGYKLVSAVLLILIGLTSIPYAFIVFYMALAFSASSFMINTLKPCIMPEAMTNRDAAAGMRRNYFLFFSVILQWLILYFLSV